MKRALKTAIHKTFPSIIEDRTRIKSIESKLDLLNDYVVELKAEIAQHDTRVDRLKKLLEVVEPYQPLYGLAGLIGEPKRTSVDRCKVIEKALGDVTGLRMLDIGSSLGYVSYYFADRGASVEGWDSNLDNVETTRLVGDLNGISNVHFKYKELNSETISTIPGGEFDVAFVLSVFHHVIYFQGMEKTKELARELLNRVPVVIVELAKKGEDTKLRWDKAQPDDELEIFSGLDVHIEKIGDFHNHLSDKTRPLYVISRKKEKIVNDHHYAYESSTQHAYDDSQVAAYGVRRRYYFGKDIFIKEYSFDNDSRADNLSQIMAETALLIGLKEGGGHIHNLPEIIDFEFTKQSAKIVIRKIEGALALNHSEPLTKKTLKSIVKDILKTLADLESLNIYHNDIRSWNIMIGKNGAWLLDYGLASSIEGENNMVSFLWSLQAIMSRQREAFDQKKLGVPARNLFDEYGLGKVYDEAQRKNALFGDLLALL